MDIISLLNPAEASLPSLNYQSQSRHQISSLDSDREHSLGDGLEQEAVKINSLQAEYQKAVVTPHENARIHHCQEQGVNDDPSPFQSEYEYLDDGRCDSITETSLDYLSAAFATSDDLSKLPRLTTTKSWLKTIRPIQRNLINIPPPLCHLHVDARSDGLQPRLIYSCISSPLSFMESGRSSTSSACSAVADSGLPSDRSVVTGSPYKNGLLTSPTNSLVAFASVAIADYGLVAYNDMSTTNGRSTVMTPRATADSDGLSKPRAIDSAIKSAFTNTSPYPVGLSDAMLSERIKRLGDVIFPCETDSIRNPSVAAGPMAGFEKAYDQTTNHDRAERAGTIRLTDDYSDKVAGESEPSQTTQSFRRSTKSKFSSPDPTRMLDIRQQLCTPSSPSGDPALHGRTGETGPRCSYTTNCTTGSPLRKVVSHIFGRNKLCTRQIPKGVWVHYCRKHYQRSRYRNPRGFALLQCDLVRNQIDRLQLWGGVADWIVKVRKREEERLNKETVELVAAGAARLKGKTRVDQLGDGVVDREVSSLMGTWGWLVQSTGSGKSTTEILNILERIEREIGDSGSSFPDVEILPIVIPGSSIAGRGSSKGRSKPGVQDGAIHVDVNVQRKRRAGTGPTADLSTPLESKQDLDPVTTTRRSVKRPRMENAKLSLEGPVRVPRQPCGWGQMNVSSDRHLRRATRASRTITTRTMTMMTGNGVGG